MKWLKKIQMPKFSKPNISWSRLWKSVSRILATVMLCMTVIVLAAKAPEIHGSWIRNKVGSKVYLISGKRGTGTGFAIKAPSGVSYILTNDHVCEVSDDKTNVMVTDSDGEKIQRRIIARSGYSDLCLIEGMPGVVGLSIGSSPEVGQVIAAVGHPRGYDITLSRGEVIQYSDIAILLGYISITDGAKELPIPENNGGIKAENCAAPKHKIVNTLIPLFIFLLPGKACIAVTKNAYRTNMLIQPGSSGSPVVDFWGNVVGAVFAGDSAMWGVAVSRDDIAQFLKLY